MICQPCQGLWPKTFHRDLRKQFAELILIVSDPAVSQNDVGIKNLTCERIDAAWSDGGTNIVVQPANKVVVYIFRILIHVGTGRSVLVINFDRVRDSDFLEGLVPCKDSIFHPAAISNRSGVFDVEDNWLSRRADGDFWVSFFEVPAIDVANGCVAIVVLREVRVAGGKEANSLISHARLVAC